MNNKNKRRLFLGLLFFSGFVIRMVLAYRTPGFAIDINCFTSWSERLRSVGFSKFYSPDVFSDYPPGYLYILYFLGGIRKLFHLTGSSAAQILLIKMPAILCDMLTAGLIYSIGKRKNFGSEYLLLFCVFFYIFNPMVLLDSAVWGQVESVYVLLVVLMCLFLEKRKLPLAYLMMAIGLLIKPQMIFFGPVLLCGIINQVFLHDFSRKKILVNLSCGLASIGVFFGGMVPFGVGASLERYFGSVNTYPYDSVNGYNLYALFGMNWEGLDQKFLLLNGSIWNIIFLIVIIGGVLLLGIWKRDQISVYFLAGVTMTSIFFLAVSMHERYLYPAGILFLLAFVQKKERGSLVLSVGTSIVCFFNMYDVLYYYDAENYKGDRAAIGIIALIMLLVFVYMCLEIYHRIHERPEDKTIREGQKEEKFHKKDGIILGGIIVAYSVVAFINLGSMSAPQTFAKLEDTEMQVVMKLPDNVEVHELDYYMENCDSKKLTIDFSEDGKKWEWFCDSEDDEAFRWTSVDMELDTSYIRITGEDPDRALGEIVLLDSRRKVIRPENAQEYPNLFDESDTLPKKKSEIESFYYGTYFDEIYHARTAYEFIHGLYSYENTHPPFGKILISIGIRIFGMNPFGWRVMGTIFGILMLPLLYGFTKKFLKSTWLATVMTLLFAFDFMHFAQTRIATIDVYVVFFVLLMYYFMYCYMETDFYKDSRKVQYGLLALCGFSMGLGIASKFTGIYAGMGLFFLFFFQMERQDKKHYQQHPDLIKKRMIPTLGVCVVAFILVPAVIYILSYLPFNDESGHGLWRRMWDNQISMVNYHTHLVDDHPFASYWYQWPMVVRPIWYFTGATSGNTTNTISAFGNPAVWWVGVVAFVQTVRYWIRDKDWRAGFLVVSFMAQFLPWVLVPRTTFIYHYFACVPFLILMIGYCISKWKISKREKYRYTGAYTVACGVLFFLFYPALSGQTIAISYVKHILQWFTQWTFV